MDARRPLVFLCGPAIDKDEKKDRRCSLRGYIHSTWKRIDEKDGKKYIHAFPVIIEDLINFDQTTKGYPNIKTSILEEIVANISHRTYIFLDTMSTGYELGQFTNFAYSSNRTSILVDEQFKERTNNQIGYYIQMSFSGQLITYPAAYNNRGHIFFPLNKNGHHSLPKELRDILDKDNPVNSNEQLLIPIAFSKDDSDITNFGFIVYHRNENNLTFSFNVKNLFYFVSSVYRRTKEARNGFKLEKIPESVNDEIFSCFLKTIKKELLTSFVLKTRGDNKSYLLSPNLNIDIKVGNLDSNELIYHILYMLYSLHTSKGKMSYVVPRMPADPEGVGFPDNEIDLLNVKTKRLDGLIKKHLFNNYLYGVQKRTISVRNKARNIISYSNDYRGRQLKQLHKEISSALLTILPSSDRSFAYKKGVNTLKCLKQHDGNTFFEKFDIHHFFESITLSKTRYRISEHIKNLYNERFNKMHLFNKMKDTIGKSVSAIIRPLFYNYKLPIGFINSPKISDFYLYELDEKMKTLDKITYTRYADDILISSKDINELNKAKILLLDLIGKEDLSINNSKARVGSLIHDGDSFKYLGINIVFRSSSKYEYTVGRKYLVETSKMCCSFLENKSKNKSIRFLEVVRGRLLYIKSISKKSFNQVSKLIEIKTNRQFNAMTIINYLPFEFLL